MWQQRAGRAVLSFALLATLLALAVLPVTAVERPAAAGTLKIGVLKFGTVNWELDVIKAHGLEAASVVARVTQLGVESVSRHVPAIRAAPSPALVISIEKKKETESKNRRPH